MKKYRMIKGKKWTFDCETSSMGKAREAKEWLQEHGYRARTIRNPPDFNYCIYKRKR